MNTQQGRQGEQLASEYLQAHGYTELSRNLHFKFAEADLVMEKGNIIIIVEVKQRSSLAFGSPEEAVGRAKLHKLRLLVQALSTQFPDKEIQVDVIGIDGNRVATHLQNIEFS